MNVFGLGGMELVIIAAIIAVIFGIGRLPEIGGAMGKTIKEFKRSVSDEEGRKPVPVPATVEPAAAPLPQAPEGREGAVRREEI